MKEVDLSDLIEAIGKAKNAFYSFGEKISRVDWVKIREILKDFNEQEWNRIARKERSRRRYYRMMNKKRNNHDHTKNH